MKLATTWCPGAIQIRTAVSSFKCVVYIFKSDCFCAVFEVEGQQHFVIVKKDCVYKGVDERLPVFLETIPYFV